MKDLGQVNSVVTQVGVWNPNANSRMQCLSTSLGDSKRTLAEIEMFWIPNLKFTSRFKVIP